MLFLLNGKNQLKRKIEMQTFKPDLSIIIPFAGEYPQVLFTVQSIAESLHGKIEFEIIVVNNHCQELEDQWSLQQKRAAVVLNKITQKERRLVNDEDMRGVMTPLVPGMNAMKSGEALKASAGGNPWLRYLKFDKRLSHWECKRQACAAAHADTFLFLDAHCIVSDGIANMFDAYTDGYSNIGTFHMPITYKILEWHRLIYKMVIEDAFYGYSFTGFPSMKDAGVKPIEVPCMSTCGMMISREVYDRVGGWPTGMGAYGGGENFMNYALAVTGAYKFIYPAITCHHHGEKRDYHSTYDGTLFNRLLAHYLFGGIKALTELAAASRGNPGAVKNLVDGIVTSDEYQRHRKVIRENTTVDIDTWRKSWEEGE